MDDRRSPTPKASPDGGDRAFDARRRVRGSRELHGECARQSYLRPCRRRLPLRVRHVHPDHANSGSSQHHRWPVRSERRLNLRPSRRHLHYSQREPGCRQLCGLERWCGVWGISSPVANRFGGSGHGHDVGRQFCWALRQRRRDDHDVGRTERHHEWREFDRSLRLRRFPLGGSIDDRRHRRFDCRQRSIIERRSGRRRRRCDFDRRFGDA